MNRDRISSAHSVRRRTHPRTVSAGSPSTAAIRRCPKPAAALSPVRPRPLRRHPTCRSPGRPRGRLATPGLRPAPQHRWQQLLWTPAPPARPGSPTRWRAGPARPRDGCGRPARVPVSGCRSPDSVVPRRRACAECPRPRAGSAVGRAMPFKAERTQGSDRSRRSSRTPVSCVVYPELRLRPILALLPETPAVCVRRGKSTGSAGEGSTTPPSRTARLPTPTAHVPGFTGSAWAAGRRCGIRFSTGVPRNAAELGGHGGRAVRTGRRPVRTAPLATALPPESRRTSPKSRPRPRGTRSWPQAVDTPGTTGQWARSGCDRSGLEQGGARLSDDSATSANGHGKHSDSSGACTPGKSQPGGHRRIAPGQVEGCGRGRRRVSRHTQPSCQACAMRDLRAAAPLGGALGDAERGRVVTVHGEPVAAGVPDGRGTGEAARVDPVVGGGPEIVKPYVVKFSALLWFQLLRQSFSPPLGPVMQWPTAAWAGAASTAPVGVAEARARVVIVFRSMVYLLGCGTGEPGRIRGAFRYAGTQSWGYVTCSTAPDTGLTTSNTGGKHQRVRPNRVGLSQGSAKLLSRTSPPRCGSCVWRLGIPRSGRWPGPPERFPTPRCTRLRPDHGCRPGPPPGATSGPAAATRSSGADAGSRPRAPRPAARLLITVPRSRRRLSRLIGTRTPSGGVTKAKEVPVGRQPDWWCRRAPASGSAAHAVRSSLPMGSRPAATATRRPRPTP